MLGSIPAHSRWICAACGREAQELVSLAGPRPHLGYRPPVSGRWLLGEERSVGGCAVWWPQRPALVRGSLSHIGDLRAQLAFAEGDPGRAAHLAGAAEGLRRRSGFSTWPTLRRGEAELAAQARQTLGTAGLNRRSPPGPRSASRRRWPPSGTSPVTASSRREPWRADPIGSNHRRKRRSRPDRKDAGSRGAGLKLSFCLSSSSPSSSYAYQTPTSS